MGSGAGQPDVAGGLAHHVPVLASEAVGLLALRSGGRYVDTTFGAGGYTRRILASAGTQVLALDRDPQAIARGAGLAADHAGRLTLIGAPFSALEAAVASVGWSAVDGIVFDLGVSSMQLDEPARGFSFRHDGPLDMRMSGEGPSAADLVAMASDRDLTVIIATLGEERHARAVARAIVKARDVAPITTTAALATIVARVVRAKPGEVHPATRTFQALRMFVNDELSEIARGLAAAERILAPGGRLAAVSFHSLEDRVVKTFLVERSRQPSTSRHQPEAPPIDPSFVVLTRKPVPPDDAEVAGNPRARSAKLRAAERSANPPRPDDSARLLPPLPAFADLLRGRRP